MGLCCDNITDLGCIYYCDGLTITDDTAYSGDYIVEYIGANHTIRDNKTKIGADPFIIDTTLLNENGCYQFRIKDVNKNVLTIQNTECFKIKTYA